MNAKEVAKQLTQTQRDGILLMGNPEAAAGTLDGELIGQFKQLQILHKREDGVLAFSDFGKQVLAEVKADQESL